MKGGLFFALSSFFILSVIGSLVGDYLGFRNNIDFFNLRGPWNVNFGILVIIGFYIYYLLSKFYTWNKEVCMLRIIFDILLISVLSLLLSFISDVPICLSLLLAVYFSYFTIFPIMEVYKKYCKAIFSNPKKIKEQVLMNAFLFIAMSLIFGDIFICFIREYK